MSDITNTATIRVVADASGVEAGLRQATDAARNTGRAVSEVGAGATASSRQVEAAQRSIVQAIQRTTLAMEAGGKSTAAYFEAWGSHRGVDANVLAPYINRLKEVEQAQVAAARTAALLNEEQSRAAEAARAQAVAQRELAQAQAARDSFVAGLREQVALFGASTEEVLRYRAAQIGATDAAEPFIAQLRQMRAEQEQATQAARESAEAARAQTAAQRELAQAQASREAFISGLREQIQLFGRSTEEVLRYRAAEAGASQEAAQLILQLQNMRAAQEQVAQAARDQADAQRAAAHEQAGRDSFIESLQQQTVAIGRTRTELLELRAAELGVSSQAAPFITQLRAAEGGLSRTGTSAAQMANAMRMVPAQLNDIVVSLAGGQAPLTVFMQQGSQLRDMFGSIPAAARGVASSIMGLINPYTVAAVALGGIAYAYNEGSKEAAAFSRAIINSGNAAGASRGQLADYAREISKTVGTQGQAAAALAALTETGKVGADNIKQFAASAVGAQNVLGRSLADTVSEFSELGKSPLAALDKLNDRYHFLTSSVYAQVKALQDQGKTSEAAALAQQAYADGIDKQRYKVLDSLTDWERGWLRIKNATSGAIDAMLNIGRGPSDSQKMDALLNVHDTLEANMARANEMRDTRSAAAYQKMLDQNEKEIAALRAKGDATKAVSKAEADAAEATEARNNWLTDGNKYLERAAQAEQELAKARNEGAKAFADQDPVTREKLINDRLIGIRKQYADVFNASIESNIAALKRREALEDLLGQRALARIQSQRNLGTISEDQAITQSAHAELVVIDRNIATKRTELAQIQGKIYGSPQQKDSALKDKEGEIAELRIQRGTREAQLQDDLAESQDRRRKSSEALYLAGVTGATAERNSLLAQTEAQFQSNQAIGLTTRQVAELEAARLYSAAALKDETAAAQAALPGGEALAKVYQDQAQQMRDLADAKVRGAAKQEIYDKPLQDLNAMVDILGALDQAAQSAAQGMASAFGSVGSAIGGMTTALTGYERTQAAIAAQLAGSIKDAHGDPTKIQRANQMAAEASAQAQIKSYGDMGAAAKGFFKENTAGYRAMEGVEKTFRAFEMAMALTNMAKKLGLVGTYTTAVIAGKQAETEATIASVGPDVAATMAKGQAAAVTGVANQAQGDPYTAWPRMAAMAAMMVGLGFAVSGGRSSVSLSQQRQEAQGAGSVLGDSSAKSESIQRALDAVEKNTYQGLSINYNMLATLRSIDTNIGSFASQLMRSTDVTGKHAETTNSFGGGFLGSVMSSIFGGKTSVADTGFTLSPTSLADALTKGVSGMQYTDMHKSGGWFSSGKDWTESQSLGAAANTQFSAVIKSLAGSVKTAGEMLGLSGDDFTNKLNSFVIDIGKVSLKDLKGDDLQKAVESIFSKLGDDLAQFAVGGLQDLQQVGEGYLETLARIGAEYQTIDVVFQSFGKTFGEVGVASAGARDRLVQLAGGLDKFTSQGEYFLTNFFSEQEQAAALKSRIDPTLAQYGLSSSGENAMKVFQDFIVCLDTTTEAGAKTYTELMSIAPAFKTVVDAQRGATGDLLDIQAQTYKLLNDKVGEATVLERQHALALADLSPAMRAATQKLWDLQAAADAIDKVKSDGSALLNNVDNAYSVLQGVVGREKDLLQKRIDKETEAVNQLKGLTDSIASTLDSFKVPGTELSRRQAAQSEIRANLAITKAGGSLSDDQVASLKKALSVVTEDVSSQFGSYQDYLRDLYQTKNDIAALGSVTGDQLDTQQAQLDLDKKQVEQYDLMLTKAQEQVNVLKGISTTGLNIEQALQGLGTAILGAKGNSSVAGVSAIAATYQSALGRAPDAAGLDYWQNIAAGGTPLSTITDAISNSAEAQVQKLYKSLFDRPADAGGLNYWLGTGSSIDTIRDQMMQSDEYKKLHHIPGFANGGDFAGGIRAVGEKGIEIEATGASRIHSTQAIINALRNPSNANEALVTEVRGLREEVKQLREANSAENRAIAKGTQETAGHLDAAVNGDTPLATKVLA
jgi:phage-related minor tail protein